VPATAQGLIGVRSAVSHQGWVYDVAPRRHFGAQLPPVPVRIDGLLVADLERVARTGAQMHVLVHALLQARRVPGQVEVGQGTQRLQIQACARRIRGDQQLQLALLHLGLDLFTLHRREVRPAVDAAAACIRADRHRNACSAAASSAASEGTVS
jgi:hypothetical protein